MLETFLFWGLVFIYISLNLYEFHEQYTLSIGEREPHKKPGYLFWFLSQHYYLSGRKAMEKKNYKKAVLQFKRSLHFDRYWGHSYLELGKAFSSIGKIQSSLAMVEKALEFLPENAEVHFNMGLVLFKQGKFQDALSFFDKACSMDGKNLQTVLYKGASLFELRQIEASVECYINSLEEKSECQDFTVFIESFFEIFECIIHKGISNFFDSLDIKYEDLSYSDKFDRSFEGIYCNKREGEFTSIEKAAILMLSFPASHCAGLMQKFSPVFIKKLADVMATLSDIALYEKKIVMKEFLTRTDWKHIISLEANEARRFYNLGKSFLERDNLDLAINQFKRTLRIEPNYVAARKDLGLALARSGNIEDAILEWERGISLGGRDPELHKILGDAYAKQGKLLMASSEWKKASAMDHSNDEVR